MKEREEPEAERRLAHELQSQLDEIRREEVPERLLDLARQLQALLRKRDD